MDDPTRRCENDTGIETRLPGLRIPSRSPSFHAAPQGPQRALVAPPLGQHSFSSFLPGRADSFCHFLAVGGVTPFRRRYIAVSA